MSPTLEKQILERWPDYFRHRGDIKHSLMSWGFDCKDGWFHILWDLFGAIERGIGPEPGDFEIVQVKQKFSELRVYTENAPPEIDSLIEVAAEKAIRTCEVCGHPGVLREDRAWWMTLCDCCAQAGTPEMKAD